MALATDYPFLDILWTMIIFFAFVILGVLTYMIVRPPEDKSLMTRSTG